MLNFRRSEAIRVGYKSAKLRLVKETDCVSGLRLGGRFGKLHLECGNQPPGARQLNVSESNHCLSSSDRSLLGVPSLLGTMHGEQAW